MSAEFLSLAAGVLLSLVFSYVPGLNAKFKALQADYQRLIMLAALALASIGVFGVACLGWIDVGVSCDQEGALAVLQAFVLALIANQSAYAISPGSKGAQQ